MHNISSTWWAVLITLGTFLVAGGTLLAALGNINLSAARDRERAVAASEKAVSMLKNECADNLAHLNQIKQSLVNGQIPIVPFETTAWEIVLNGGLLAQVDTETLGKLTDIYHLIGLANEQQTQLVELATGMTGTLSNAPQMREQRKAILLSEIDQLEPKLTELTAQMK